MKNGIFESALINLDEALLGILSLAINKFIYNNDFFGGQSFIY